MSKKELVPLHFIEVIDWVAERVARKVLEGMQSGMTMEDVENVKEQDAIERREAEEKQTDREIEVTKAAKAEEEESDITFDQMLNAARTVAQRIGNSAAVTEVIAKHADEGCDKLVAVPPCNYVKLLEDLDELVEQNQ